MNDIDEIKDELLELGFNVDSIGIIYWVEAIKMMKENFLGWDMTLIYEKIGEKYNTIYTAVERNMRTCIEKAKPNIQKKYNYYKNIKNQTFLSLIRFKLI